MLTLIEYESGEWPKLLDINAKYVNDGNDENPHGED
jgi:hypothetical protein